MQGSRGRAAPMAIRSLSVLFNRNSSSCNLPSKSGISLYIFMSSRASPAIDSPSVKNENMSSGSLKNAILRLKFPNKSTGAVLQDWVGSGRKVTVSQLRSISSQLLKLKRHNQALEVSKWMETQNNCRMSAADHAIRVELIVKVHGLRRAEDYFKNIPDFASQKAASLPLLHGYVKERNVEKAEAFMMNLSSSGLVVNPHYFNEMMKIYMATSQYEKVPLVIREMKQNNIPRNFLSYNLWMIAHGEISEVTEAEKVYKEMVNDENVKIGWSTLSTLANVYIKANLFDKALSALENAEKMLSTSNHLGYFFLITLYTSLKNKDGVLRLWKASKLVDGRISCANYMSVISCLVKLGDLVKAERVLKEWESNCRKYDIRVSNVLLGAYMRNGMIDKAESLHLHTLEKGGCPNYKTWEILMEGWVEGQKMDKAMNAMKKGFPMLKNCYWRPSESIVMAIAEYIEKHGNFEDANHYIRITHQLGIASLPLYKLFLRMHISAQRAVVDILKMMEKDNIEMDDETSALVQAFQSYV